MKIVKLHVNLRAPKLYDDDRTKPLKKNLFKILDYTLKIKLSANNGSRIWVIKIVVDQN